MANQVSPQVDIGGLTLRGLSAFTPLLASLSTDNVAPTAMLQMENLGGCFLISGEYAAKVPDYLQRCSSVRLERLALTVGWRKGDAASLMAASAGGQAVALLSLCLHTLYSSAYAGDIFLNLSRKLLPSTVAISSMVQLVAVGDLLKAKLETLRFGNLLAKQVTKVHDAYRHMGLAVPADFLQPMSSESMTELLESVSRALRDESKILRITGTYALGHILGLILMMFPRDTLVTINGFVLFEGTCKSILVEFEANGQNTAITQFQLETLLSKSAELSLPIKIEPQYNQGPKRPHWSFSWNNWVADLLQLEFLYHGLTCPKQLLSSCCDVLIHLPELIKGSRDNVHHNVDELPSKGLLNSLGPNPFQRICDCCQAVYGSSPSGLQSGLPTAYSKLAAVAMESLILVDCSCQDKCNPAHGWCIYPRRKSQQNCRRLQLWNAIGLSLEHAFWCLFMNAGTNTTMRRPNVLPTIILSYVNDALSFKKDPYLSYFCGVIHYQMINMFADKEFSSGHPIGFSSGANVIFPAALRDVKVLSGLPIVYEVLEGKFILEGRYHMNLRSFSVTPRKKAKKNMSNRKDEITPTSSGEHENLTMTVRECLDFLELRTMIRGSGQNVSVSLLSIIISSYGLEETEPCDHPEDSPLDTASKQLVMTTSVVSPATTEKTVVNSVARKRTSIAQTKHNPTAQLLGCEKGVRSVLLKECCLNCALSQVTGIARPEEMTMIIV